MTTGNYAERVKAAINYSLTRMGSTIVYKRFQAPGEWSPTGATDILWEEVSASAVVYGATTKDIEESGGRLRLGDKAFAFLGSIFTDHTDYEYIKFTSGSVEFTAGETITGATDGATGVVINHYEDSGTWAGGDATGVVWVSTIVGTFNASENLNGSTGGTNMATTTATNTSGGSDDVEPKPGDEITYDSDTFYVSIQGEGTDRVVREDVTSSTYTVWGRSINE